VSPWIFQRSSSSDDGRTGLHATFALPDKAFFANDHQFVSRFFPWLVCPFFVKCTPPVKWSTRQPSGVFIPPLTASLLALPPRTLASLVLPCPDAPSFEFPGRNMQPLSSKSDQMRRTFLPPSVTRHHFIGDPPPSTFPLRGKPMAGMRAFLRSLCPPPTDPFVRENPSSFMRATFFFPYLPSDIPFPCLSGVKDVAKDPPFSAFHRDSFVLPVFFAVFSPRSLSLPS